MAHILIDADIYDAFMIDSDIEAQVHISALCLHLEKAFMCMTSQEWRGNHIFIRLNNIEPSRLEAIAELLGMFTLFNAHVVPMSTTKIVMDAFLKDGKLCVTIFGNDVAVAHIPPDVTMTPELAISISDLWNAQPTIAPIPSHVVRKLARNPNG